MVGIKYVHSAALLKMALEVSFTFSRGAGGFSVSPFFRVRGLVRDDSPAFKLLWARFNSALILTDMEVEAKNTDTLQQLRSLFDQGEAAPGDVDPEGRTLFHVSHAIADKRDLTQTSSIGCSSTLLC